MRDENAVLIPRTELLDWMSQGSLSSATFVVAPAGYGKSVLSQLWCSRETTPSSTLLLDEYDNYLVNFCQRYCTALFRLAHQKEQLRQLTDHPGFGSSPDEYAIYITEKALPYIKEDAQFVIDDLHNIHHPMVLSFIAVLLKRLLGRMRILILSREAPPKALSDLVVKDGVRFITVEQMRFTPADIGGLYQSRGISIDSETAEEICRLTAGWPMGVQALLLSKEKNPERKAIRNHFTHFIRTEVWENWSQSIREFMLKISVADEMTPDLCLALTGEVSSQALLKQLVSDNAFLSRHEDGAYQFHALFRTFLLEELERMPELALLQRRKAADWYFRHREYEKAIHLYVRNEQNDGIIRCLTGMIHVEEGDSFAIDKLLYVLGVPAIRRAVEQVPYFLPVLIWSAFLNCDTQQMESYADYFYRELPTLAEETPELELQQYYIRCIDYRAPLQQMTAALQNTSLQQGFSAEAGTFTQNMPLFHRSTRDFSEYVGDTMEKDVEALHHVIRDLFGRESQLLAWCIVGGLYYEEGKLEQAYRFVLMALSEIKEGFSAEVQFCALMLQALILDAQQDRHQAIQVIGQVKAMIDREKAFFLNYNLNACICWFELYGGGREKAQEWLDFHGAEEHISFYHLYGHFTTARAWIALGEYDKAIILLNRLLQICETYRRPIDVIEIRILLAIAFWKKKRAYQKEGLAHLEQAILTAAPYGYIQAFVNESADVSGMLYRLHTVSSRKNYGGALPGPFVKTLYLHTLQGSKKAKGLTGGQEEELPSFTGQQKKVMRLLCEGYSYQQVADKLGIKFSTVRSHTALIFRKLDVPNVTEAILKIKELGILEETDSLQKH